MNPTTYEERELVRQIAWLVDCNPFDADRHRFWLGGPLRSTKIPNTTSETNLRAGMGESSKRRGAVSIFIRFEFRRFRAGVRRTDYNVHSRYGYEITDRATGLLFLFAPSRLCARRFCLIRASSAPHSGSTGAVAKKARRPQALVRSNRRCDRTGRRSGGQAG